MVSQQENSKKQYCRNSCFSQLCRMGDKGQHNGKFLLFCLDISPRFHTLEKLRQTAMDPQRWTKGWELWMCSVCREGTPLKYRRAVCWDPNSGGQNESRIVSKDRAPTENNCRETFLKAKKVASEERTCCGRAKKDEPGNQKTLFLEPNCGNFVVETSLKD